MPHWKTENLKRTGPAEGDEVEGFVVRNNTRRRGAESLPVQVELRVEYGAARKAGAAGQGTGACGARARGVHRVL